MDVILKEWTGWKYYNYSTWPTSKIAEMAAWVHIHASGEYHFGSNGVWFKNDADLTAFILRWA